MIDLFNKWKYMSTFYKYYIYKISMSLLLLFVSESGHAEITGGNIRVGLDYFGYKEEKGYIDRPGFFVGGEILWEQLTKIPGHPEPGVGIEYQFPRGNGDKFNFVPVYGSMSFKIASQADENLTKLVFRIGYNWFEGEDYSDWVGRIYSDNYGGGVYYGIGIDNIINNKYIVGLHVTQNTGTNKIVPLEGFSMPARKVHISYRKVNFNIGYMFH